MPAAIPVPEQPGRLFIPATGAVVQQDSQYEGDFYDTVEFTTFAVGTKEDVFKDQTDKELQHTNLNQEKRIPSHSKLKLMRIGVHVRQWAGMARPSPEDVVALYELAYMTLKLGKTNIIAEGPLLIFPSGLGVTGTSTANDFSLPTLGVPSPAAAPRLIEQHDLNDKMDLNCQIKIDAQEWLGDAANDAQPTIVGNLHASAYASVLASVFLHGVITQPLGS